MPSKLNDTETAICLWMADARCYLGVDQAAFGAVAGISRDRIASYENLRAPLRFHVADRICERWGICQRFLRSGEQPRFHYIKIDDSIISQIPERELFSKAYDGPLRSVVELRLKEEARKRECTVKELDDFRLPDHEVVSMMIAQTGSLANLDGLLPVLMSVVRRGYFAQAMNMRWKFYRDVSQVVERYLKLAETDRRAWEKSQGLRVPKRLG